MSALEIDGVGKRYGDGDDAFTAIDRIEPTELNRISAAVEMADDPLAYLKDAVQAREGLSRRRAPFAYRAWRKAMLPAGWPSVRLPKVTEPTPDVTEACFTAKNDGKAFLVVIPSQRLVFYLWCD